MSIPAAYISVVLIWSTTPLTIAWSGHDVHFLFGLAARMLIGLGLLLILHLVLRKPLRHDWPAQRLYLLGGIPMFVAMTCVYWSARYIPSGWISVVFGATPLITGIMAMAWLGERAFTPFRITGQVLGLTGLAIIFYSGSKLQESAVLGVVLVLMAVLFHSTSAVWVKRLNPGLDGISATTGSLLVATPLYALTWLGVDGVWPESIPFRAGMAIVYLGVFGSVIGFTMYFFLLRNITASRLALITLMTPVLALWLGQWVNDETVSATVCLGTGVILLGLATYEWGERLVERLGIPLPRAAGQESPP